MDEVGTRPATAEDCEFAYQVKRAALGPYVAQMWGWDEDEQRALHARLFEEQCFEVIQRAGSDVGVLAVERRDECIKLNQIMLLPHAQGAGVGAAVLALLIRDSTRAGLPIRLQVLRVNLRAMAFYERLGFVQSGRTDTHVLMKRDP